MNSSSNEALIKQSVDYIETNLHTAIQLEDVASFIGFSKFHFHRLFQAEIGMTIGDYIRKRRICRAASDLLFTEESILAIAIQYGFETQESFTRAFKRIYTLPPGQYRKLMSEVTKRKEEKRMDKTIKGWMLSGSHPFNYEIGVDPRTFHQGRVSGFLRSVTTQGLEEFGTMMQQFKAQRFTGKRFRLSAFIKTKNVQQFVGMWMRVDSTSGDVIQFDNMSDRPITGDTNWNHYSIVLDVPEDSAAISFGVLLVGRGHVWMDSISFQEVDHTVATTNLEVGGDILDEPTNLSFEE